MSPLRRGPRIAAVVLVAAVVLLAVGLLVLDAVLSGKARAEAEALSRAWGRPVEVGSVAVTLFTGAGARVTGLRIGPAQGEEVALLEVARAEVKIALLGTLFSGGKNVGVRSVEVSGLRANVVRFPDGTTNVERLKRRLAELAPRTGAEEQPADLSRIHVDRAVLAGARVALVDRTGPAPHELVIDQFDAEVTDLRAGRPLALLIRAAVLSAHRNLELRLSSAPLPSTLVPTPDRLTLKVEPIDLAPLAPFLPASVGLRAGQFQADLDAALGGAVPGGSGPTRLQGTVRATGLSFAGQEGGKALDVVLDANLNGDAAKGDLRVEKLRLDFGPAGLSGKGRVSGLVGEEPRVDGLEIVSHDLDPAILAAYAPPLRELAGRVSGPVGISLRGSGEAGAPALVLRVDLTPVRLSFPRVLAKAAGARAELTARLAGAGAGALRFDLEVDLVGLDLRPGESLNKAPGDRLALRVAGSRRTVDGKQAVELSQVELLLPGEQAAEGKAAMTVSGPAARPLTHVDASLTSRRLDLDRLLLPGPASPRRDEKPLDPAAFRGLSGTIGARLDRIRVKKTDLSNVVAEIQLQEDEVVVQRGRIGAFGGTVSVDGTRAKLAHPAEPFALKAEAVGIDLGGLVGLFTPQKVISGRFDGRTDLTGRGRTQAEVSNSLAGVLAGKVIDGTFHGKDLVAGVAGPLARALPFGLAGKEGKGGATSLGKEVSFSLRFRDGAARLEKPMEIARPEAQVTVGGGFRLDGSLDLAGTVALSPQTVSGLTGGRARPQGPIPVSYKLTGPAWNPTLSDLGLAPAVQAIVKEAGTAALGKALGVNVSSPGEVKEKAADEAKKRVEDEAKKRLQGLFR